MKEIEGFERYSVTKDGRVWSSFGNGRWLKPGNSGNGYLFVNLSKDGKIHPKAIHRLVALTYIPNPDNKREVNHINGIKTDNRVKNLEWSTPSENKQHAYDMGLYEQQRRKLSKPVICVETGFLFPSARAASEALGLCKGAVKSAIHKSIKCGGFTFRYV